MVVEGVLISKDPKKMDFRLEHTHFVSDHGEGTMQIDVLTAVGGHYHYDVTPDEIEYWAYFVPCQVAYRIERAYPPKHKAGLYWN